MVSIKNTLEIEKKLGESIKSLRLQKNIDRKTLCERAEVSLNGLRHLEGGNGSTLRTLIRILRALGRADWFDAVAPQTTFNPLHMTRERTPRQRARKVGKLKNGQIK